MLEVKQKIDYVNGIMFYLKAFCDILLPTELSKDHREQAKKILIKETRATFANIEYLIDKRSKSVERVSKMSLADKEDIIKNLKEQKENKEQFIERLTCKKIYLEGAAASTCDKLKNNLEQHIKKILEASQRIEFSTDDSFRAYLTDDEGGEWFFRKDHLAGAIFANILPRSAWKSLILENGKQRYIYYPCKSGRADRISFRDHESADKYLPPEGRWKLELQLGTLVGTLKR